MSTYIDSLKKQNAFLQSEIERYASAVDSLAEQLASAQGELTLLRGELHEPELPLSDEIAQ